MVLSAIKLLPIRLNHFFVSLKISTFVDNVETKRGVDLFKFKTVTTHSHYNKIKIMDNYNNDTNRPDEKKERGLTNTQIILRAIFGVLMIIVYVGMGIFLIINLFGWTGGWGWTLARYVVGVVLILYGLYRAYRQIKGIDSPL